jgi:hypothetical protein
MEPTRSTPVSPCIPDRGDHVVLVADQDTQARILDVAMRSIPPVVSADADQEEAVVAVGSAPIGGFRQTDPRRFVCDCIPPEREEAAAISIPEANRYLFSSEEERIAVLQTGALSELMYQIDFRKLNAVLKEVNEQFFRPYDQHLEALPTALECGLFLPESLSIQAFIEAETKRVYVCIRGTQLDKDPKTRMQNLIADLGIGDLKASDDLSKSIQIVCNYVSTEHNVDLKTPGLFFALTVGEALVQKKVTGTTDEERHKSIRSGFLEDATSVCRGAYDLAERVAESAKEHPVAGAAAVVAAGAGAVILGPAAALSATLTATKATLGLGFIATGLNMAGRAVVAAATSVVNVGTKFKGEKSPYDRLLDYVGGCDAYIEELKRRGEIPRDSQVIVTGHSLGGYLAGVTGAIHGDKVFAYNGPGVIHRNDVVTLLRDLKLEREVRVDVDYNSYSQSADFIGCLFARDGTLKGVRFPHATYPSPLAHHGIRIMNTIFGRVPFTPLGVLRSPRVELLRDDEVAAAGGSGDVIPHEDDEPAVLEANAANPPFNTAQYFIPSSVLMLEDLKPDTETL